jgi:hypothetical protein
MFPVMEKECSFSEDVDIHTEQELAERTKDHTSRVVHLECSVDGEYVQDLHDHRLQLPMFDLDFPEDNVYGVKGHRTRSTANGFWVFLKDPLEVFRPHEQEHTIYSKAIHERPFFYLEVMYKIMISSTGHMLGNNKPMLLNNTTDDYALRSK